MGEEMTYDYEDLGDGYDGHDASGWAPYRSVAQRRADAEKHVKALTERGEDLRPAAANGRKIASTFWGQAWCRHLEGQHDYESRLPRGRSYLRNGSVIDLQISEGKIWAQVCGSNLYWVDIRLDPLAAPQWQSIVAACAGRVGSVLELLAGKISDEVMAIISAEHTGLFPHPDEIHMSCSCPDHATMCKHVSAALYGVGVRLDEEPELFFTLRGVDYKELIATPAEKLVQAIDAMKFQFDTQQLENLFGIDINLG